MGLRCAAPMLAQYSLVLVTAALALGGPALVFGARTRQRPRGVWFPRQPPGPVGRQPKVGSLVAVGGKQVLDGDAVPGRSVPRAAEAVLFPAGRQARALNSHFRSETGMDRATIA